MFPFSRFVFSKYNSFPRCHKFACALLFKCPMSFFPIAIKLTTAQVEGEVMCNSIMAVAHRVMLTCDLVYNRCHCDIKQHLSSIWKSAPETGTTGASLGSTRRSSMSSRRSTPPSGCTSTSCATNQTLPMGSWQSTGVLKRDHLVDLLINTAGERYFKKYLALLKDSQQILGNGPHKLWDRPDVVRLSCHWWIHPYSHG